MELCVQKIIDFRSIRALQICIVFAATLLLERLLGFSRAGWIGFVVMMIYVGFDAGSSLQRTFHRFWGTMIGLLLSYLLWWLGLLDYRLELTIIPIVVFFAFFSLGKFYAFPTIFTVTLTSLGTAYFSPTNYDAYYFFFDYFRATLVAFIICIGFDGLFFKNAKITRAFHQDLRAQIVSVLQQLFTQVTAATHRKKSFFLNKSAHCHLKIAELAVFERNISYDYSLQETGPLDI